MPTTDTAHDLLRSERRPLDAIFAPRTVAVVGATEKAGSVGRTILWNLISNPFGGTVYPVNPNRPNVLGIKAYPRLEDLPEPVDLAVIVTPAATVPGLIGECVEAGTKGAIVISAGFKETGAVGAALEAEVMERARKGRMRIIGPNCLGVMRPFTGLNATFAGAMARPGNVAFISQSGALGTAILDWSLGANVGFSAFASIGSMLDVDWGDLIDYLGDDPQTRSIVLYMESIGDARSFLSAAREVAMTKPIIVIKAGRTEAAARAAASHTGSLAGSDEVFEAAFRRGGVLRVGTISDVFAMTDVLAKQPRPKGPKLTIVTNAGGPGVLATDALIGNGGSLAEIGPESRAKLDAILPAHWSHANPIDVLGDAGPDRYAEALAIAADEPGSDGLLVILTPQAMTDPTGTADALKGFARVEGKPVLASWMGGADVAAGEAREERRQPSSSASAKGTHKGGPRGHGFGMNAIHSESTVKKSDGTYQVDRHPRSGAVTAVSATSITLKSDDGFTATYVVDSSTKVRDTTNKVIGDITVGETVQVVATKTDSADTATTVGVPMAHTKKAAASSAPAAG